MRPHIVTLKSRGINVQLSSHSTLMHDVTTHNMMTHNGGGGAQVTSNQVLSTTSHAIEQLQYVWVVTRAIVHFQ